MAEARYTLSVADYDNEIGTFSVRGTELTAANFDTQTGYWTSLKNAALAIMNATEVGLKEGNIDVTGAGPDSDASSQRELKWLVQYVDDVNYKKGTVELPCADTAHLDPNDRAHAHIGDTGDVDAFITAFEAVVRSRDGNAVTVKEITLVGRNV